MNYKFDINEWMPRFPLQPRYGHFDGEIITSPCDVCNNEQLRQGVKEEFDWGEPVPVDIFVMAEGEPKDRHVTKLGGLPFRPHGVPWPTASSGDPMLFLAQFNFASSRDLYPDLPGDLLLVFADGGEFVESIQFEWQPLGTPDLISAEEIPSHPDAFDPCYGHVLRTVSYPAAKPKRDYGFEMYPKYGEFNVWSWYHLLQYQATQIGRAPFFIQEGDSGLPGQVLCTISSVQPDQHKPYPWVNHPEPLMPEDEFRYDFNYLMMGDVGCIYISIDDAGRLHWCESCY
jgi:hypothetical protein